MLATAQKLGRSLYHSGAVRQSAILLSGTVLTGVLMAVAMIVASRTLGPAKFGVFSVSVAIMSILSKGVDLGLNQLIPRLLNRWYLDNKRSREFIAQVLLWKIRLVGVTTLVGLLSIPFVISILNYPHVDMLLWAVVGALVLGLYEHVYLLLSSRHMYGWVNVMAVSQALIKTIGFTAIFFLAAGSLNGISAIYYLAPFVCAFALAWQFRDWMWVTPATASAGMQTEMQKFIRHALVGVVAMTLISNVDVLLVQHSLNTFETGLYAGATRIAAFIGFVTAAVGGVMNNRASRYRDRATLRKYLVKSLSIVLLAILGFAMYLPLARLSLLLTIGPEYLSGLTALIILVLNAFLSLAIVPYISFFYAVDHPAYFSVGGVLQVVVIVLGNWLFLPLYGIEAAAWVKVAATVAFGIYTVLYLVYALRRLKD